MKLTSNTQSTVSCRIIWSTVRWGGHREKGKRNLAQNAQKPEFYIRSLFHLLYPYGPSPYLQHEVVWCHGRNPMPKHQHRLHSAFSVSTPSLWHTLASLTCVWKPAAEAWLCIFTLLLCHIVSCCHCCSLKWSIRQQQHQATDHRLEAKKILIESFGITLSFCFILIIIMTVYHEIGKGSLIV